MKIIGLYKAASGGLLRVAFPTHHPSSYDPGILLREFVPILAMGSFLSEFFETWLHSLAEGFPSSDIAGPAPTPAVIVYPGVLCREFMPVIAMCFLRMSRGRATSTKDILLMCYWFKMIRVDAPAMRAGYTALAGLGVVADVIQLQPTRDLSTGDCVANNMGEEHPALKAGLSVSETIQPAYPFPARPKFGVSFRGLTALVNALPEIHPAQVPDDLFVWYRAKANLVRQTMDVYHWLRRGASGDLPEAVLIYHPRPEPAAPQLGLNYWPILIDSSPEPFFNWYDFFSHAARLRRAVFGQGRGGVRSAARPVLILAQMSKGWT